MNFWLLIGFLWGSLGTLTFVAAETAAARAGAGVNGKPAKAPPVPRSRFDLKPLRQAYLEQQKAIRAQAKGATQEQRDQLHAQLETAREAWLEEKKELREAIHERVNELRDRLPNHREILDEALEKARNRGRGR